jgi:dephospho-CoA kinase
MKPSAGRVFGLTGYYCSGKSSVRTILENEYNFYAVDVDSVGHRALKAKQAELVGIFGNVIIAGDGSIDRKKMAGLVFGDKKNLERLNSVVHPWMVSSIKDEIASKKGFPVCIDAALLFSMGLEKLCDTVLIVTAPFCTLVRRGRERDKRSLMQMISIIRSQKIKQFAKKKINGVDIQYITNSGTVVELAENVRSALQ